MAKTTKDARKILRKLEGDDPELRFLIEQETVNARVAQMIYEARKKAGLTQEQLAKLIGTGQPTIARLEDADYQGHSLLMLMKISATLGKKFDIRWAKETSLACAK